MRFLTLAFLFLVQSTFSFGQQTEEYARAEISLQGHSIEELARLGVETDHGTYRAGKSFTTDFSLYELNKIKAAGFETKVLIADVEAYYAEQRATHLDAAADREGDCSGSTGGSVFDKYVTPSNYTFGSMGGYHTYDELLNVLDDMQAKYPDLITAKTIVSDTITTHEGRPLYFVKISKNANQNEAEPKVLYTALHHCREPNGMSQMLFYMWHLLENYGANEEVDYILNNMELYFIPCVNPDGYLYNQANSPNGGGLWRKNRRDNLDGTFGVDLNRNYGYEWGFDDNGSSPDPGSTTYRGPSAFSEPESRMVRDFCLAHNFEIVLNYHTFSNLLIIPWSYSDSPADTRFVEFADLLVSENGYRDGTASQTVGYAVNGSSDDWMFAGADALAMTPEVGPSSFGFWPPSTAIDGLNKEAMFMNLVTAQLPLHYARLTLDNNANPVNNSIDVPFTLKRYSIQNADFKVALQPISANVVSVSMEQTFSNLDQFETAESSFQIEIDPTNTSSELVLLATLHNGFYASTDTLRIQLQVTAAAIFEDDLSDASNWNTSTGWALTTSDFVSAPTSMTDSPNGDYSANSINELFANNQINIPANAIDANLRFSTKWSIEEDWDLAYVEGSSVNQSARALCGIYAKPNPNHEVWTDQPLYDGLQDEWVEECMSLKDFIGEELSLVFKVVTDGFVQFDGFYFDDLRIEIVGDSVVQTIRLDADQFSLRSYPNPTKAGLAIQWENTNLTPTQLVITDVLGRVVLEKNIADATNDKVRIETASWEAGNYFYQILFENGEKSVVKQFVVD